MNKELKKEIKDKNNLWLIGKNSKWCDPKLKNLYIKKKLLVHKNIQKAVKEYKKSIAYKFKYNPKLVYSYINEKRSVK
jgi:hypothetical protein